VNDINAHSVRKSKQAESVPCVPSIMEYFRHKFRYCCLIRNDRFRIAGGITLCSLIDGRLTIHGLPQTVRLCGVIIQKSII
jgi:hypothetical protein